MATLSRELKKLVPLFLRQSKGSEKLMGLQKKKQVVLASLKDPYI
mgnify:CR=1 FL=1